MTKLNHELPDAYIELMLNGWEIIDAKTHSELLLFGLANSFREVIKQYIETQAEALKADNERQKGADNSAVDKKTSNF